MFNAVKLLCTAQKRGIPCLHPAVVPENKYMKIANKGYRCPKCGHENRCVKPYFISVMDMRKAAAALGGTGVRIDKYRLAIDEYYDALEIFERTPHILENDDWDNHNMEISAVRICLEADPLHKTEIWEDLYYKAKLFISPGNGTPYFFDEIINGTDVWITTHKASSPALAGVVKACRRYGIAWRKLAGASLNSAPCDLTDPLSTMLCSVDSLAEILPSGWLYE